MNPSLEQELLALESPHRFEHRVFRRRPWFAFGAFVLVLVLAGAALPIVLMGGWPGLISGASIYLGFLLWVIIRLRRVPALTHRSLDASVLLFSDRAGEAVAAFDRLALEARDLPRIQAVFVLNRGIAATRTGNAFYARLLFAEALRSGWLTANASTATVYTPLLASSVALSYAVDNDLDQAQRWLTALDGPAGQRALTPLLMLLPTVLVYLKRNEPARALNELDEYWLRLDGALPGTTLRELQVLRAWAEQLEGNDHASRRLLDGVRVRREQLEWLTRTWPEFERFVADVCDGFPFADRSQDRVQP